MMFSYKTFNWNRYYVSLPKETSPDLATVIKVVPTANNGSPELLKLHHEQVSVLVFSMNYLDASVKAVFH